MAGMAFASTSTTGWASGSDLSSVDLYRDYTPAWAQVVYSKLATPPSEPLQFEPMISSVCSVNVPSALVTDWLSSSELEFLNSLSEFDFDLDSDSSDQSSTSACQSQDGGHCAASSQIPLDTASYCGLESQAYAGCSNDGFWDLNPSAWGLIPLCCVSPLPSAELAAPCPSTPPQPVAELNIEQAISRERSCRAPSRSRLATSARDPDAPKRCQVPGCLAPLEDAYNIRYKLCKACVRAPVVRKDDQDARFCQQCGYLHAITEFDGSKRSCRKKLQRHANRVRKWRSSRNENKTKPVESELQ